MDIINILIIIVSLLNLLLGLFVFFRNPKSLINRSFLFIIISILLWSFGMIMYRFSDFESVVFWCKILYLNATFTASTFLLFCSLYPENKINYKKIYLFYGLLINLFIIYLTFFTNKIILGVDYRIGNENVIIWGKLYFIYIIYILFFFFFGYLLLFKKIIQSSSQQRIQLIYVFSAYAISGNLAFMTNLILPSFSYVRFNWLGQILTIIHVLITAYSIIKYRLFDIRLAISRGILYSILILIVALSFTFITFSTAQFFEGQGQLLITLLVSIIIVIGLDPLKHPGILSCP